MNVVEKIDALELRKNIELSLIEDEEGKTIPVEQAFKEIRQGLNNFVFYKRGIYGKTN